MCDSLIPTCKDFADWQQQYNAKGAQFTQCVEKHASEIKQNCDMCQSGPSTACLSCMSKYCPGIAEMYQCTKCLGRPPITEADFQRCASCGGTIAPLPLKPTQHGDWIWWVIGGVVIAVILLIFIYFRST